MGSSIQRAVPENGPHKRAPDPLVDADRRKGISERKRAWSLRPLQWFDPVVHQDLRQPCNVLAVKRDVLALGNMAVALVVYAVLLHCEP